MVNPCQFSMRFFVVFGCIKSKLSINAECAPVVATLQDQPYGFEERFTQGAACGLAERTFGA